MSDQISDHRAFQKLWKEHYRSEISEAEAAEYEERLVRLVKLLIDLDIEAKERAPP